MPRRLVTAPNHISMPHIAAPNPVHATSKAPRLNNGQKPMPMGKSLIGYHHTKSPEHVRSIQQHGFRKGEYSSGSTFFSNRDRRLASSYGRSVIKVKVPRKAVNFTNQKGGKELFFGVDQRYLKDVHNRRVKNTARKAKGLPPIRNKVKPKPPMKPVIRVDSTIPRRRKVRSM